jgi:hypothetical protein
VATFAAHGASVFLVLYAQFHNTVCSISLVFPFLTSATALKERGIAVIGTVRKGASGYPPRLLQLKKINRGLIWGELQASIIGGVYC